MSYSENEKPIRVMMLVASLPPNKVGGAEMQALRLGKELLHENVQPWFVTPGTRENHGEGMLDNLRVSRPYSIMSFLFSFFSRVKSKRKTTRIQIEFDDSKQITNRIQTKVSWPTLVYMRIFYWNCILSIGNKIKSMDVIHAHTMEWSAIVAVRLGKKYRKPVLIKDSTMNGFESLTRFPDGERLQEEIKGYAYFVAMTNEIEKNFKREKIADGKFFRVPNGIKIQHQLERRTQEQNKKVLFVGNLYQQPAKGVDILLKAWKVVVQQFPTAQLLVVGDGSLSDYKEYVDQLGIKNNVEFLGKRNDVNELYATANLFVLPSRREGMSNALLEAMMHGVPCIATNISGNQDIIEDGKNGLLVPPADIAALAKALIYLLNSAELAESMGKRGRETILQRFDIRLVAKKYRLVYEQLLHGS